MVKRPREFSHTDRQHNSFPRKNPKVHNHDTYEVPYPHSQIPIGGKFASFNEKHPSQTSYAHVPAFDPSKLVQLPPMSASVPPLPPLSSALALAPFTHSSSVDAKYGSSNSSTYERLEFLGDAYLEIIATRLIYSRFPELITGKQAKLREKLVRNSTLARFARAYGFGDKIIMDFGHRAKFGIGQPDQAELLAEEPTASTWEKILADMFEAYVAAAILSDDKNGFAVVEEWLTTLWLDILLKTDEDATLEVVENRKEELARLVGGKYVKIEYAEERPMGRTADRSRQQNFIAVYLTGWGFERKRIGRGIGVGKKEAGMRAAADALDNNRAFIDEIATVKRKSDEERRARIAMEKEQQVEKRNGEAIDDK